MSEESIKVKSRKRRMDLLAPEALQGVADALGFGAEKHGEHGWEREPMKWSMPVAALLRHLTAWQMGEDNDPEMGISHMDAIQANAHILSTYIHRGIGNDDRECRRPPPIVPTSGDLMPRQPLKLSRFRTHLDEF